MDKYILTKKILVAFILTQFAVSFFAVNLIAQTSSSNAVSQKSIENPPLSFYKLITIDLKRREGFSSRPYLDAGQWAIGYGQHFKSAADLPVYPITETQATEIMNKMLEVEFRNVSQQFPQYENNEKWALTSLVFNVGMTSIKSDSVFWNALKNKNTKILKSKWFSPVYAKSSNHKKSRELEWALFSDDLSNIIQLHDEGLTVVKYRYEKKMDFYEWRTKKNMEARTKQ